MPAVTVTDHKSALKLVRPSKFNCQDSPTCGVPAIASFHVAVLASKLTVALPTVAPPWTMPTAPMSLSVSV